MSRYIPAGIALLLAVFSCQFKAKDTTVAEQTPTPTPFSVTADELIRRQTEAAARITDQIERAYKAEFSYALRKLATDDCVMRRRCFVRSETTNINLLASDLRKLGFNCTPVSSGAGLICSW